MALKNINRMEVQSQRQSGDPIQLFPLIVLKQMFLQTATRIFTTCFGIVLIKQTT
jgi:hypothetical protein